jgi:hypothetical protein
MQAHRIRLQDPQLELFRPQFEVIDWHKLPRETQQKTMALLTKLLREHSEAQQPRSAVKEGAHE